MPAKDLTKRINDLAAAMQAAAGDAAAEYAVIERAATERDRRYEAAEATRVQEESQDIEEMDAALLSLIEGLDL